MGSIDETSLLVVLNRFRNESVYVGARRVPNPNADQRDAIVVRETGQQNAVIIDPVLDYEMASGRTSTASADAGTEPD